MSDDGDKTYTEDDQGNWHELPPYNISGVTRRLLDRITELEDELLSLRAENSMLREELAAEGRRLTPEETSRNIEVLKRAFGPMYENDHPSFWRPPDGAA